MDSIANSPEWKAFEEKEKAFFTKVELLSKNLIEKHKTKRQEQHAEQDIFITGFIIFVSHDGSPQHGV